MTNGIILAGGRGTRLGPLAAQISKALVSIGQRPHLAHQIELLRKNGCDTVVVVTSPETNTQIRNMIERAGLRALTTIQSKPRGPVDAIRQGLEVANINEPSIVIMADTYIDEALPDTGSWVGVGRAPYSRSFCAPEADGSFVDKTVSKGDPVTVGVYRFESSIMAYAMAAGTVRESSYEAGPMEVGMAAFLSGMAEATDGTMMFRTDSWLDLGDVTALARARQEKFIARDSHSLKLTDHGTITKTGAVDAIARQGLWLEEKSSDKDHAVANLFPRVFDVSVNDSLQTASFTMEYVDLPTLSELWLYWPGRPDTWADILQSIIQRVQPLWQLDYSENNRMTVEGVNALFIGKARRRLAELDEKHGSKWLSRLEPLLDGASVDTFDDDMLVRAHGDLNFNNILFSLNTGAVKLIDPRGDEKLPLLYEFAKLRYSYHAGFSAITHGLFDKNGLFPDRFDEIAAMDAVIAGRYDINTVQVAEGMLLLAGAALHPKDEAHRMLTLGESLLKEVLG